MRKTEMKIGIAYTTHNRNKEAKHAISQCKKYLPKHALLIVVDDASEIPFKGADYRFDINVGIAKAKNMCLELLYDAGCTHIFLYDDDTYPIVKDWHLPYLNSGINHLCMTFPTFKDGSYSWRKVIAKKDGLIQFHEPCGMMLYFTRICLDKVGGMDEDYGRWGYEHPGLSMRIHNAGLTPKPFLDVENSHLLIYSKDWDEKSRDISTVDLSERQRLGRINKIKYQREIKSSAYIPFKEQKGVVLTTYLTGSIDPQRGEKWTADIEQCRVLAESVKRHNTDLVVINDCFDKNETDKFSNIVNSYSISDTIKETKNPYFLRWLEYRDWLRLYKPDNVFLTDCNDVELLRHPFKNIQPNKLYVGWEKDVIGCQWMLNHHKSNFGQTFIKCNMKTPLLNAGVIGGRYEVVMEFLDRICDMISILPELSLEDTDMATFNWVLYSHFNGRFETGEKICTTFKAYDYSNKISIWRHK